MSELLKFLLAAGLTLGGHEVNHVLEADRQEVQGSFKKETGAVLPVFMIDSSSTPEQRSRIHNAGFEGQEIMTGATSDTGIGKPVRIASALNKLGYALMPGGIQGVSGDVDMLGKSKGKSARKVAQGALTASAISDLLKAFGKTKGDSGLKFGQSSTGTPMLMYGGRF